MCEVLLRVVDKVNEDPYLDAKLLKRGDVVVIVEDGHAWGREELANPDWRIVKLPNVTSSVASAFLGDEKDTDPTKPSRVLRRRAFRLDWQTLPAAVLAWLADDTRAVPTRTVNISAAQLLALKVSKTPLADSAQL